MRFHRRCGDRVTLLNDNSTAVRNFVEFNHGLILSAEPLKDDVIFEVCIDRKVNVWNGSLEIGVTTLDPEYMELPATATKLRNTAWIMSGSSIVKDGVTLVNSYGPELDTLREEDCLGVMRTSKNELMFYINGRCLGIAARDLPPKLFAVIDLYGQCVQVSIIHAHGMRPIMETSLDQIEEDPNNDDPLTTSELDVTCVPAEISFPKETQNVYIPMTSEGACALVAQDRLRFHPRCGILVKLSANNKTAERARPLDDYNNGVVMTHRPLYDNELFEIRIDRLVDKWSGSIEVGVTTHNPATIRFPSTMTNMDSGTIMMSGCKVLLNGHGTCMEYGNFNLDELREGDTVGMMRKSNGKLHYFINGVDQGVATDKVEQQVWGVIDLYGMTVKVSIVDPCEDLDININNVPMASTIPELPAPSRLRPRIDEDSLLFHTLRDSNVIIINDGKTAHRPNAFEFFNNGIVMTNRTLRTNELFQVRLDLVIPKWAGSIEIGVTQHSSNDIQFPFKMSNAKSGTWAMTGEDVIRDGTIIIPQYVRNLNRLVEGDTVGVMRKDLGILHFFVNGVDQGPAAFNIPEHVFGIIDLYGRVAQATIVDSYMPPPIYSPESPLSTESNATIYPEMCFHRVHGRNARLSRNRLTASRATVYSEFNDAVLFSSRPLRECDMFELRIDKMVDCWIGSLEIGVTAIRPDDLEANGGVGAIAGTATDLNWDTYILSGAAMMKDGECVRSGYPLDLDTLTVGSRVGLMWHADRSLHYYLDGMDMGKAWYVPHLNIYAVVDLYGQCTQVTILQNEERAFNYNGCTNSDNSLLSNSRALSSPPPPYWSFSEYCGDNVCLLHDYSIARRLTPDPTATLVFSSAHLALGEIFEIKIVECKYSYAGSFRTGVTDINILNAYVNRSLPPSVSCLPHYTAYIDGRYIKYSRKGSRGQELRSFVPSFEWLRSGDRIGLKKTGDGRVFVYYNSEQLETAFENVPDKVYVIMELSGKVTKIESMARSPNVGPTHTIPNDECLNLQPISNVSTTVNNVPTVAITNNVQVTSDFNTDAEVINETVNFMDNSEGSVNMVATECRRRRGPSPYTFHHIHGKNIKLCSSDTVAIRTRGFNNGIVIVSHPLTRGHNIRFRIDKINPIWVGTVTIGAVASLPTESVPSYVLDVEPPLWAISDDILCDSQRLIHTDVAAVLDELVEMSVLTIHFKFNNKLVLDINGELIYTIATVSQKYTEIYPLIDLYGKVSQISVLLHHTTTVLRRLSLELPIITEKKDNITEFERIDVENSHIYSIYSKSTQDSCVNKKNIFLNQETHIDVETESVAVQPGPSYHPDPTPQTSFSNENDMTNKEITPRKAWTKRDMTIHSSLILPLKTSTPIGNNNVGLINTSRSVQDCLLTDSDAAESEIKYEADSRDDDEDDVVLTHGGFFDTNIRHNDRYPEANDVDNLDNEIMDALTLETGNLPDLTEEQSSSIDESTTRDDIWVEPISIENSNYLNSILNFEQRCSSIQNSTSDRDSVGEGCEHLHMAMKYWNFIISPHPELRQVMTWAQVRCYCSTCQPLVQPPMQGWVRIKCAEHSSTTRLAYWHISRLTLKSVQPGEAFAVIRPRSLVHTPTTAPPLADIWFDDEGKPHHIVLAVEIAIESADPMTDKLVSFLIYFRSTFIDEYPSSLEE